MKRMRGLLAHSPSLAISMLALVFALGSGAGYAASTAARAPGSHVPVLAFHHLKLGKGSIPRPMPGGSRSFTLRTAPGSTPSPSARRVGNWRTRS
jgi:hypothetical protein